MIKLAFVACLACAGISAAAAQTLPAPATARAEADRRQLEEMNHLWFESYRKKDGATLGRILADDFVAVYGGGSARTKAQLVDGVADPKRPPLDIRSEDVLVSLFGDTAMVSGRSITKSVRNGQPVETSNHYADIYVKRRGKWQAVAAHVVQLAPQSR